MSQRADVRQADAGPELPEQLAQLHRRMPPQNIEAERAVLSIQDDGVGFDPATVPAGHYGLKTMGERARKSGGDLQVRAAPGEGTRIAAAFAYREPFSV